MNFLSVVLLSWTSKINQAVGLQALIFATSKTLSSTEHFAILKDAAKTSTVLKK